LPKKNKTKEEEEEDMGKMPMLHSYTLEHP
jgi:hypothetical protein